MKCFNHHDADAVAVCKRCQKGICSACAIDIGHSIVCSPEHQAESEGIEKLVNRNMEAAKMQPRSAAVGTLSWLIMGAIFLGFGIQQHSDFLIVFGGFGLVCWVYLNLYNSRVFKKLNK